MPRYSAPGRASAVCTALRGPSLYAVAAAGGKLRQIDVTNSTATEFRIGVIRWTAAGTQGAALTEAAWDPNGPAAQCTAFNTHTADATAGDVIAMTVLGAAIGSSYIWTVGADGLGIPQGTANGGGVYLPGGTGQSLFDFAFVWDE